MFVDERDHRLKGRSSFLSPARRMLAFADRGHRELGRRLAQNLVGQAQLVVLPLKSLHLVGHIALQACSFAAVDLGLLDSFMRRGWRVADLGRD